MNLDEVRMFEFSPSDKRRPVLALTRQDAIGLLRTVIGSRTSTRQQHDPVYPLFRLRSSPDQKQLVDRGCGGGALRDDQHARALLSTDERREVVRHRSTVVRHQYSSLIGASTSRS